MLGDCKIVCYRFETQSIASLQKQKKPSDLNPKASIFSSAHPHIRN